MNNLPKGIFAKLLMMRRFTKPKTLEEYVGHYHLLQPGQDLLDAVNKTGLESIIVYGPSGIGKTTIGGLLSKKKGFRNKNLHFVAPGKLESKSPQNLDEIVEEALAELKKTGTKTALFLDEIHRASKNQQIKIAKALDAGAVAVIGTTVFKPEKYLIPSFMKHCKTVPLMAHKTEDLKKILQHILKDHQYGLGDIDVRLEPDAIELLCKLCNGNAKNMLIFLEREVFRQLAKFQTNTDKNKKAFLCRIKGGHVKELYSYLIRTKAVEVRQGLGSTLEPSVPGTQGNT